MNTTTTKTPSQLSAREVGALKYYFGSLVQFALIESTANAGRLSWQELRELYCEARKLAAILEGTRNETACFILS